LYVVWSFLPTTLILWLGVDEVVLEPYWWGCEVTQVGNVINTPSKKAILVCILR